MARCTYNIKNKTTYIYLRQKKSVWRQSISAILEGKAQLSGGVKLFFFLFQKSLDDKSVSRRNGCAVDVYLQFMEDLVKDLQ